MINARKAGMLALQQQTCARAPKISRSITLNFDNTAWESGTKKVSLLMLWYYEYKIKKAAKAGNTEVVISCFWSPDPFMFQYLRRLGFKLTHKYEGSDVTISW